MAATQVHDVLARVATEFEEFSARLNGGAAGTLHEARRRAMERLGTIGFPTLRDEEWRFTNMQSLFDAGIPAAASAAADADAARTVLATLPFLDGGAAVIVFVNGTFDASLSRMPAGDTALRAHVLPDAAAVEGVLAVQAALPAESANAFAELNTAFVTDGVFIDVKDGAVEEAPVHVVHVAVPSESPVRATARVAVRCGASAGLRVTETFVSAAGGVHHTNAVTQVLCAENASLDHLRTGIENTETFHTSTVAAELARSARLHTTAVTLGGRLVRNDVHVRLAGEGAEATLDGLSLARGTQHIDNHTVLDHAAAHCPSHEMYKGIYDESGRGVFSGRIIVRPGAQKTDAKQSNDSLVLSDTASVDTKPQLEIFADDVKCTHGATIGRLDDDALFYLRARGIGEAHARAILTVAFAAEVLERMPLGAMRDWLDALLHERLDERAM